MSHNAEKCEKGDPFGFINIHSVAKYQKNSKGGPFGDIKKYKIFEKKSHGAKRIQRGDHLGTPGFVDFLEKVKMKGGPFGLSLPWPDLALGGFRIVSKKWTDQCEDCSLKKKKVTAIVGHFSLKGKRAD